MNTVTQNADVNTFSVNWPIHLTHCHPVDNSGGEPFHRVVISGQRQTDEFHGRFFWCLLLLITGIHKLWYFICVSVSTFERWNEWLLVYVSQNVLNIPMNRKIDCDGNLYYFFSTFIGRGVGSLYSGLWVMTHLSFLCILYVLIFLFLLIVF